MFDRALSERFLAGFWPEMPSLLLGTPSPAPCLAPAQRATPATGVADVHVPWIGSHFHCYMRRGSCDPPGMPLKGVDVLHPRRVSTTIYVFAHMEFAGLVVTRLR